MTPDEVKAAQGEGAVLLDMRTPKIFAEEHIPGAINLQFNRADLVDRAELVLPMDLKLIVQAKPEAIGKMAVKLLEEGGFTVLGHLEGGLDAWKAAGHDTKTMPTVDVDALQANLSDYHVVDSRDRFEWKYGRVPGAALLSWTEAWDGAEGFADPGRPIAVVCGDEVRSSLVASMLERLGHKPELVMGGMVDWIDREYEQEKGDG